MMSQLATVETFMHASRPRSCHSNAAAEGFIMEYGWRHSSSCTEQWLETVCHGWNCSAHSGIGFLVSVLQSG